MDVAARNTTLGCVFGAYSTAPSSFTVSLYAGDPLLSGTELTSAGGYAAQTLANTSTGWPSAPANGAITSAVINYGTSTGAWSATATHLVLRVGSTIWYSRPLAEPISVTASGTVIPPVRVTVTQDQIGVG